MIFYTQTNMLTRMILPQTTFQRLWLTFRTLTVINSFFVGLTAPLEVIFFLSLGFDTSQIGILMAIQGIGVLISDIPTGAFADRYGRKKSLIISFSILTLVFCVWAFSTSFLTFSLLSFIWGIGFAFQSGTKTSLLMDNLALSNNDERRTKIFSHLAIYGNIGLLVGGLAAAAIASHSLRLIWVAAAIINASLAFISLVGIKNDNPRKKSSDPKVKHILKDALICIKIYFTVKPFPLILLLESTTAFILSAYMIVVPFFLRLNWNISDAQFGLLGSLAGATGIIGALLGERFNRCFGFRATAIFFAIILLILFYGLAASQFIIITIACYALIELLLFGWDPIEQSFINKFLPNDKRTVMLSASSSTGLIIRSVSQTIAGLILLILRPQMFIIILGWLFIGWPIIIGLLSKFQRNSIVAANNRYRD